MRAGQLNPVQVTEDALARIAAADPVVGAFRRVRAEQARAEAAEVAARPDLAQLPLAGVPVAVKDVTAVTGNSHLGFGRRASRACHRGRGHRGPAARGRRGARRSHPRAVHLPDDPDGVAHNGVGKVGVEGPCVAAEGCEGSLHGLRVREGTLHGPETGRAATALSADHGPSANFAGALGSPATRVSPRSARVVPPAAAPPRSLPGWCRSRTARTGSARSGCRRRCAGWWGSNPAAA
ncbi:amidase family protein [Amycolatopsis sulphurea]|uniref:amidase family protein n=1 Tax=Amycolatopsis sulphurea TaxID=76022 RepID=UPI003687FCCA